MADPAATDRAAATPEPLPPLLVIGGGTMGAGIALVGALAGAPVTIVEPDARVTERAGQRLERQAARGGDPSAARRIVFAPSLQSADLRDVGLAIEAVPERMALKRALLADLEPRLSRHALIATNTSSLSVSEMATGLAQPDRFLGLHFFNPPPAMALVEVIAAPSTAPATVRDGVAIVRRLGKTPVVARDTPGFIVNRVARPYYLHALRVLEERLAPPELIDELATGIGMPMGPFTLMDVIGHDVNAATTESIYERTGAARLRPSPLQRELVAQGRLGRKTSRGIYRYDESGKRIDDDLRGDDAAMQQPTADAASRPEIRDGVAVVGVGTLADAIATQLMATRAPRVVRLEALDAVRSGAFDDVTVAIEADEAIGTPRDELLAALDAALPEDALLLYDAYLTSPAQAAATVRRRRDRAGYGIVGPFERQAVVELAREGGAAGSALGRAATVFTGLGKHTAVLNEGPGLFLGRTIASIVNEAAHALDEGVASAEDIDTAMRLGTNYPDGPLHWAATIGRRRVRLILEELARREDPAYAPARSLRRDDGAGASRADPSLGTLQG